MDRSSMNSLLAESLFFTLSGVKPLSKYTSSELWSEIIRSLRSMILHFYLTFSFDNYSPCVLVGWMLVCDAIFLDNGTVMSVWLSMVKNWFLFFIDEDFFIFSSSGLCTCKSILTCLSSGW